LGDVSISVESDARGRGVGAGILDAAIRAAADSFDTSLLRARIRPENDASVRMFRAAGFHLSGTHMVHGQAALELRYP
jgi:L-amino acid N-acyltransferase YncA